MAARSTKKNSTSSNRKKSSKPTKSSTKKTSAKRASSSTSSKKSSTGQSKKTNITKILKSVAIWVGVFVITLIVVDYAVQYLNHKASVAIVNGERIYRGEFNEQLEEACGANTVSQMIDEALIYQEADKEGISASDEDIDKEIESLEENYGGREELEEELEVRNITMESLRQQITTTLLVEKMLEDRIEITEEEKKEFYEEYKDVLFTEDEDPTYEEAEEQITETLMDQKLNQEYQVWIVEIQEDANIKDNVSDPKDFEFLGITRAFVVDLTE